MERLGKVVLALCLLPTMAWGQWTVGSRAFSFVPATSVATPTFSPTAGSYVGTQTVTISTATTGATLCYTTDGTTPTANGAGTCTHGTTYSTAVSVAASETLEAVGSKSGYADSAVGSAAYTITAPVPAVLTVDTVATTPYAVHTYSTCNIASATTTAGHLYVAQIVSEYSSGATYTMTGWTSLGSCHTDAGNHITTCGWWKIPASTTTGTLTVAVSTGGPWVSCAVAGETSSTGWPANPVDAQSLVDTSNFSATHGVPYTLSAGATTTANSVEWVVGLFGKVGVPNFTNGSSWVATNGFTTRLMGNGSPQILSEDYVSSAAGTYTAQSIINDPSYDFSAQYATGYTVAFKPN